MGSSKSPWVEPSCGCSHSDQADPTKHDIRPLQRSNIRAALYYTGQCTAILLACLLRLRLEELTLSGTGLFSLFSPLDPDSEESFSTIACVSRLQGVFVSVVSVVSVASVGCVVQRCGAVVLPLGRFRGEA